MQGNLKARLAMFGVETGIYKANLESSGDDFTSNYISIKTKFRPRGKH